MSPLDSICHIHEVDQNCHFYLSTFYIYRRYGSRNKGTLAQKTLSFVEQDFKLDTV